MNYSDEYILGILRSVKTIAMVGASPNRQKFSYGVLKMLTNEGYKIIPVNPREGLREIAGLRVYPTLRAIGEAVDMVQVFRKSDELLDFARQAIDIGAKVLWGQLGVINYEAEKLARDAGLKVVMDRCPQIELEKVN